MANKFGLREQTISAIQQVFASFQQVSQVIIYGSRAKGTFKPGSDIDLTLIAANEAKLDLTIQFKIEEALEELMLPYQFDLSIMENIDNPNLLEHINRVGQVFFLREE